MQETDFAPVDGFSPVDPPVFLGLDPMLLVGAILLLLAVAAGMFVFGRWHAGSTGRGSDDAPAAIHAAILRSSRWAMAADSNELRGRAQALRDLIERLLGPVLVLDKGLSGALKDLDAAIKGVIKDEHGHGGGHGGGQGDHGGGHEPAVRHETGRPATSGGGAAAASTVTVIGLPIAITHPPEKAASSPPSEPTTRTMTHDEQTSALALSVRKFNDHWSRSDLRIRELKAARAALSRRPPADKATSSGDRVWDRR